MSLSKCTVCDTRVAEKPLSAFVAWRTSEGNRVCYKAQYHATCYAQQVAPLDLDYATVVQLTCPNCGIVTENDYAPVWITSYIPKYGQRDVEVPFCDACKVRFTGWFLDHALRMEERLGPPAALTSDVSGDDVLRSLGIEPRAR